MTIQSVPNLEKIALTQAQIIKGYFQFISVDRGLMLFLIVMGSAFLAGNAAVWPVAIYLGLITFCIWSAADAIDNICDVDIDVHSDPFRAQFTKKLGKTGLCIAIVFTVFSLFLGAIALMPYVFLFTALGLCLGALYSVPPLRLRRTPLKPIVNFSVGGVPIMIVAAYFGVSSGNILSLIILMGITTSVYSLWEDLADFASDFNGGSRTVPIIMGFKPGLVFTVILGYVIMGLMAFVGVMFALPWFYYIVILGVAAFITVRLVQKRNLILKRIEDTRILYNLGEILAKDFAFVAIIFTISLMFSGLAKVI